MSAAVCLIAWKDPTTTPNWRRCATYSTVISSSRAAAPAAASVGDKALALHGAVGFTWEHDLHLFLKRVHTARTLFGSAAAHRELVAVALDLTGTADRSPIAVP